MNAFWILVLLILISGFFALSEMALASSRKSKLQSMADAGNPKATIALQIMDNPSRLLAATQTGITAAALLMGIYGESALTATFQYYIDLYFPSLTDWADRSDALNKKPKPIKKAEYFIKCITCICW